MGADRVGTCSRCWVEVSAWEWPLGEGTSTSVCRTKVHMNGKRAVRPVCVQTMALALELRKVAATFLGPRTM